MRVTQECDFHTIQDAKLIPLFQKCQYKNMGKLLTRVKQISLKKGEEIKFWIQE